MKYNIDDILIGDEVTFYSTKQQSNFDEYWTVIGKSKHQVMIELKKFHYDENWTLDIQEVVGHIPTAKR
jgi:hypothetical protein